MAPHFETKSQGNLDYLMHFEWTAKEIAKYIPQIEALDNNDLLTLHQLCHIAMFRSNQWIDREQAIRVLINPNDTPKKLLLSALKKLKN